MSIKIVSKLVVFLNSPILHNSTVQDKTQEVSLLKYEI